VSRDGWAIVALRPGRFADPAGEVGIETHLLHMADGQIAQVPVTYRAAPLDGTWPGQDTSALLAFARP
jgi:hypothetical protein